MKQDSDNSSWPAHLVRWSSVWLMACWGAFLLFILSTDINKQSVYLGKITFYGGVLYLNTLVAVMTLLSGWGRLVYLRHPALKRSSLWVAGALVVVGAVHAVTQLIIVRAMG